MYDDDSDDDILIIDEDDIRNGAVVVRRGGGRDHRAVTRPRPRPVARPRQYALPAAAPTTVVETSGGDVRKSLADWVPDVLRGLAAVMPMPNAPMAQEDVAANVQNLITYFGALSQTAQRKEQLHTLAAIAARHL